MPTEDFGGAQVIYTYAFAPKGEIRTAVLNVTVCGVYNAYIDGVKLGENVLAPGYTSFYKHHLYQTYDITERLSDKSVLTFEVGKGWYGSRVTHNAFDHSNDLALIAQLDVEYENGECETVVSDGIWQCGRGKVTFSDIYDGECCDGRIIPKLDSAVRCVDIPKAQLCPQDGELIIEHDVFKPSVIITPRGECVLDFGENITGYPFFENFSAVSGELVKLSFGEVLDSDGNFYNANYRSAKCLFEYICRDGKNSYKPSHTFFGFRYARVDSLPKGVSPESIWATDVYSDMKRIGSFECALPLVNRLFNNVIRGQKDNFLDIPTDCPQRDEREGWTGDAQVFAKAAAYNFSVDKFFAKWLCDMRLDQLENGDITRIVPDVGWGGGAAAWSDAVTIIPWTMYVMYGDKKLIADMLPAMKKYVEYLRHAGESECLLTGVEQPFGDWLGLDRNGAGDSYVGATDKEFIGAAFYAHSTLLLAKSMEALGLDAGEYFALHNRIVEAIKETYTAYDTQTYCVLALHFGLCKDKKTVAEKLVSLIHEHGDSLTTGFVGTPYLLHALSDNGYTELAYTLLLRTEYPSWLYPVTLGATTIWEHWDGIKPDGTMWSTDMNSFNHYAYGAVADWLYSVVCGIRPVESPDGVGFAKVIIDPKPDKRLGSARAELDTPHGKIISAWRFEGDEVKYEISVPDNVELVDLR